MTASARVAVVLRGDRAEAAEVGTLLASVGEPVRRARPCSSLFRHACRKKGAVLTS